MSKLTVHADAHWDGDPTLFAKRLVIEVEDQGDAEHLAAINRLLAGGDTGRLARLADLAEWIAAEDAAALDPALA